MDMLKEYGAEYTCSAPEDEPERPRSVPTYELVRQGYARAKAPEAIPAPRHEELVTEGDKPFENGQPLPGYQSKDAQSQTSQIIDTKRLSQTEETDSLRSFQTNSTAKTENKNRRKFWSRFSSQTTLYDNN